MCETDIGHFSQDKQTTDYKAAPVRLQTKTSGAGDYVLDKNTGQSEQLQKKRLQVESQLKGFQKVAVAFSGGVDSTLLLKLARDTLGKDKVLAVSADSPSIARIDLEEARNLARLLDVEHVVINTGEFENISYRANPINRCYFCRRSLFDRLRRLALSRGIDVVLYGEIGDDSLFERPGLRAAIECNVRAPLKEAGFAKQEVREFAKLFGLPNWNRPQNACLASRIPHNEQITKQKLSRVESAEAFLRSRGFRQVRVRYVVTSARIEVDVDSVGRFNDPVFASQIRAHLCSLGFEQVSVSRKGYRCGGADSSSTDDMVL